MFGFFNALTWQIGIGTPMVLFCEQLGASPFQVGLAYSFVFLLTPIQILATALLPRYGYKRVMLGGWAARTVFLIVPVWLAIVAQRWGLQPWMAPALVGSVFGFCFFRTIGAAAIMPAAAPIGSGLGIQNRVNIRLIIEQATVPVLVDAGVGTPSDAVLAMELGCDAVLMNTAIAAAQDPIRMARAMKHAVIAGREGYRAGRMPKKFYADPSSPMAGLI